MLSRVWTVHPEGCAGNEQVMCPQCLIKATWSTAYVRLVDRPIRYAAGSFEAREADLLMRTTGGQSQRRDRPRLPHRGDHADGAAARKPAGHVGAGG
jgi:hypothetical protein